MDETKQLKKAVKRSAANWPVIVTVVCFSVVMCRMANNLKDGSEVLTILIGTVATFFSLVVGYLFTGQRSGS